MERRKPIATRPSPLPADYLKMISDVFKTNFDAGLKALKKIKNTPSHFEVRGEVSADEVVLSVSLLHEDALASTTVFASTDFDPRASSPTVQDLLSACVDAAGSVFGELFSAKDKLEELAHGSLEEFDAIPFQWSALEVERFRVYVKVDKSNPKLDSLADEWLSKNDPDLKNLEEKTQKETEKLFITGKKKPD